MNEIRLPELLQQSYMYNIPGLVHKLSRPILGTPCCYSNNLASKPPNSNMHSPLKLKIQNALNQVIFADAEARGLFIGGRRRNRKKRKHRNGGKDKKKPKKSDGKTSPSQSKSTKEIIPYIGDEKPLIESDYGSSTFSLLVPEEVYFVDDLPPLVDIENEENVDPDKMPFGPFKKKVIKEEESKEPSPEPVIQQPEKVETPEVKTEQKEDTPKEEQTQIKNMSEAPKPEETPAPEAEAKPEQAEEEKKEETKEESKEPNGTATEATEAEKPADDGDGAPAEDKTEVAKENIAMSDVQQPNGKAAEESSPLIGKSVKAAKTGILCCTIL